MRRSTLFCQTLRETPADAELPGYALLLRGGFVQPLAAGIFSFLPLGECVKRKVEMILREEMNAVGGQEVALPVVHPAELWRESGRWEEWASALATFRDRSDRDLLLAATHEEVVTDLLRKTVRSFRQLPVMLYQIQTKFRDEPRARGGLLRAREFTMKDAYSCHADQEDLVAFYQRMHAAYLTIFRRAGLPVISVESDVGLMGGSVAHEFEYLSDVGEDRLVLCERCGYAANMEVATFHKPSPFQEDPRPLERVSTPGAQTIAALARFLDVPASRTAKAAFFEAGHRLIFAVVRGDMEVNERKLANASGVAEVSAAGGDTLARAGIVPGYASPIGVTAVTVVVDDLVAASSNLVAGANEPGYHLMNTNYGRDYEGTVADIAAVPPGAACGRCHAPLEVRRGVEVGNIFNLGARYSRPLGATFLDRQGQSRPILMASYGIGVGRLIASLAEEYRDQRGLRWPRAVAPFDVYLVGLDLDDQAVAQSIESVYDRLLAAGIDVLYDDRPERAGVKFNDADLLGIPVRLTVSRRTLAQNRVEIKPRTGDETRLVPRDEMVPAIQACLESTP